MRIQHNIMAMNAYRNYNTNTSALAKNLEKLSSGYRINRAGDDAAGLAISEKMRAQITGLDAAQKNVKDGISLVKTAEGAMQEIHDMLGRMKYLATQSANGTYDNEVDRANLQKEVNSLLSEIDRIADSANFNGQKLLNGELDPKTNLGLDKLFDLPSVGGTPVTSTILNKEGQKAQKASFSVDLGQLTYQSASSNGKLKINIGDASIEITLGKSSSSGKKAWTIGKLMSAIGKVSANKVTFNNGGSDIVAIAKGSAKGEMKIKLKNGSSVTFTSKISGSKITFEQKADPTSEKDVIIGDWAVSVDGTDSTLGNKTSVNHATTVNQKGQFKTDDVYASTAFQLTRDQLIDGASITIGKITYTFNDKVAGATNGFSGTNVEIKKNDDGTVNVAETLERLTKAAADNDVYTVGYDKTLDRITVVEKKDQTAFQENGKSSLTTMDAIKKTLVWNGPAKMGQGLQLQIGDTSESYNQLSVTVGNMHAASLGVGGLDISTATAASASIKSINDAINAVSSTRGDLGAVQNRLEHTEKNLSVMQESIQDAESAIRDTDVAAEMMKYTKNNILIQSAQAMLAQANQVPQGVLQLLQ